MNVSHKATARLLVTFFFMLASAVFVWPQDSDSSSRTSDSNRYGDIEEIISRGELRVAITEVDQPPFYFMDKNGKLSGYDIDLATKMAEELGVKLVITREAPSFNDLIPLISSGKADLAISKLSRTLTRSKFVKFSTPYMTFRQGILFNRLQLAKVASEDSVNQFVRNYTGTIGVIAKSSYANYAKENFPKATATEYPSWNAAVDALTRGEVLSVYRDELEIKRVLASIPNSALLFKPIYFRDLTDPIAIAVKSSNTQLLYWVNIFLESQPKMTADQVLEKYANK
ncbi:MAG TPA: amino acid ABC transporter substrate-binding protein [Treponema sp.]|nr:amino acid ABC transporter substrate-binding protein [Treponema sp.]